MKKIISLTFILLSVTHLLFSQKAKIIRGPYLQVVTSHSIIIRWRTDIETDSKVFAGTSLDKLDIQTDNIAKTIDHEIIVKGLKPSTIYYYAIGSAEKSKLDKNQFFKTAPVEGSTQSIRIWALGDFGCSSKVQFNVRDAITKFTADHRPDFWIWQGDNAYNEGKDDEFQKNVFAQYQDSFFKNLPVFPSPGNHDYAGQIKNRDIPYFKIFSTPQQAEAGGVASENKSFYSANYGNVHIVSLDSYGLAEDGKCISDIDGLQMKWLEKDLAANTLKWTIIYWHHPPYSKGTHDSDTEDRMVKIRENTIPILEKYNVDVVIAGHSHVYERTHPLRGHYGKNDTFDPAKHIDSQGSSTSEYIVKDKNQGIIYLVNGSGGQLWEGQGGEIDFKDYPLKSAIYSNRNIGGSIILDIQGSKLTSKWITEDGKVGDQFSITK